jgi:hypothetical protein
MFSIVDEFDNEIENCSGIVGRDNMEEQAKELSKFYNISKEDLDYALEHIEQ